MKRGSALLIVLGMLSFMVVSAVAFSIYMRQNRIPSSYLRRQTASREMVKAALARAIDEIDTAIGNDPFPGVGFRASNNPWPDRWIGRVFYPRETAAASSKTVATMPFEGLAYVPPALINEVRYYGRKTPTAKWRLMDYDAGRFAYVAVNVSDFLDVNRASASITRNSSGPGRITTGYLFENAAHTQSAGSKPESFQQNVVAKSQNDTDAETPYLVSVADLALKLNKESSDHFRHPLIEYVKGGGSGGNGFYGAVPGNKDSVVKNQMLLTDSWFPGFATNVMNNVGDRILTVLDQKGGQPFIFRNDVPSRTMSALQLHSNSFADFETASNGKSTFTLLRGGLNLVSLAALYDYLDPDNIPLSLAMPTVERAPMLNALQMIAKDFKLKLKCKYEVVESADPALANPNDASQKGKEGTVALLLDGIDGNLAFSGATLFPFKGPAAGDRDGFSGEVVARIFLVPVSDGQTDLKVRLKGTKLAPPKDWTSGVGSFLFGDGYLQTQANLSIGLPGAGNTSEESATVGTSATLALPNAASANEILKFTYKLNYLGNMSGAPVVIPPSTPLQHFVYDDGTPSLTKSAVGADVKLKPCVAFWVKVKNDDGDVVDLVPATMADDTVYVPGRASFPASVADTVCGPDNPYMLFPLNDAVLDVSVEGVKAGLGGNLPATVGMGEKDYATDEGTYTFNAYCPDPRYNFAPEDWWQPSGNIDPNQWREQNKAAWQNRDDEIWMFVSDAGYLQSMGELQFLPRVGELPDDPEGSANNPIKGAYFNSGKYNGAPFSQRTGWNACANHDYFWKTYNVLRSGSADHTKDDNIYKWGICSSRAGTRVNPYGDNLNAFMAAFANTPMDWYVAATNFGVKTYSEGIQNCFNEFNANAKIKWTDLEKIAKAIQQKFKAQVNDEKALEWDFLTKDGSSDTAPWDGWTEWDDNNFFGVTLDSSIADIDRKFLFSFWRDCFDVGQQLFLVFVRAEPSVVGGGDGDGAIPPQLGGRAVALVWRDPYPGKFNEQGLQSPNSNPGETADDTPPHRIRILFYHQFD